MHGETIIVVIVIGVVLLSMFVVGFADLISSLRKRKVNGGKSTVMEMIGGVGCMMPAIAIAAGLALRKLAMTLKIETVLNIKCRSALPMVLSGC